jgi:predicted TPR repeat methyltransferase
LAGCTNILFHNYDEVFDIPGLYETLFYDTLDCCSPSYVVNLLEDVANEWDAELSNFRVLDVGAGNGMVGDELRNRGASKVVGVDIIEEAKEATLRDRPGVYDDYRVADLTNLPKTDKVCSSGIYFLATAAMILLSSPPERNAPNGTSLNNRFFTAASMVSRTRRMCTAKSRFSGV